MFDDSTKPAGPLMVCVLETFNSIPNFEIKFDSLYLHMSKLRHIKTPLFYRKPVYCNKCRGQSFYLLKEYVQQNS